MRTGCAAPIRFEIVNSFNREVRTSMKRIAAVWFLGLMGPALLSPADNPRNSRKPNEPRRDAALVFVHRKSARAGNGRALHIVHDDRLAAPSWSRLEMASGATTVRETGPQ